jgi:hypothetical protein
MLRVTDLLAILPWPSCYLGVTLEVARDEESSPALREQPRRHSFSFLVLTGAALLAATPSHSAQPCEEQCRGATDYRSCVTDCSRPIGPFDSNCPVDQSWNADQGRCLPSGANPVKSCFEGVAREIADAAAGKDNLTRELAEMEASATCDEFSIAAIGSCISQIDAKDDDSKDYYECIGRAANTCLDSAFATTESRRAVCIHSEEEAWHGLVQSHLSTLKVQLQGEERSRLDQMEKNFFEYRGAQCGLFRSVFQGEEPAVAQAACMTETLGRFAIDLRELKNRAQARPEITTASGFPGTEDGARRLLSQFLAKGADHRALTARLRPQHEDYALVYSEPLAQRLSRSHAEMWRTDPVIGPESPDAELFLVFMLSDQLGDEANRQAFPGGYARVHSMMKPGIPVVAAKFVRKGETLGRLFDGFVFVRDRWVLIPKPWRGLD